MEHVRGVLVASPFVDEGYRKVWARLRAKNVQTSKDRVRRVTREHGLSAPHFAVRRRGNKAHDGTNPTKRLDEMWGTDATSVLTGEGVATILFAVDPCTSECVAIHAACHGTRIEALAPIPQGVRACLGRYDRDAAAGLALRHDHGSQVMSDHFEHELLFLRVRSSASFVAEPDCNGLPSDPCAR